MSLDRFVEAQVPTYDGALTELRAGHKRGHWMWFVFPQLAGLGHSPTAQRYGLTGPEEAVDYLAHPVLGTRLRECTHALLELPAHNPVVVVGLVDALKLRSSMTLFDAVAPGGDFARVLEQYYGGKPDELTLQLLSRRSG
ncbi:MAG: calpastatin [Frankiales bacterium]|nr:calpastatin [Frankiales bacterium]